MHRSMKFKISTFLLLCSLALALGCSKDEFGTGSVKFINKSTNPYKLSINGASKGEISGNSSKIIDLDVGTYTLKAEQVSGYILFPTVKDGEITVRRNDFLEWSFP
jgi:hypothetical protein